MQKIRINNIKIFGYHGIYEKEIKQGQCFNINIIYAFDLDVNSITDEITSVIDYTTIVQFLEKKFNKKRYNLIEKLVNDMISQLIDEFKFKYIKLSIGKKIDVLCDTIIIEQEIYNG